MEKAGKHYHDIVTANDSRMVKPDRIRKSIGVEDTFSENIFEEQEVLAELEKIHESLMKRIYRSERKGRTITLKIKYHDFTVKTRSKSIGKYTNDPVIIWDTVMLLLKQPSYLEKEVRLLGISISQLDNMNDVRGLEAYQLTLEF